MENVTESRMRINFKGSNTSAEDILLYAKNLFIQNLRTTLLIYWIKFG